MSPFTDKQIELVETFADQAVIAIENVRLFDEVQARTRELSEALEQQTATSEVLQVISSSPGDSSRCSRRMLENAVRICEAKFGNLYLYEDDSFRVVAHARMRRRPIRSSGSANRSWPSADEPGVSVAHLADEAGRSHYRSRCRPALPRTRSACRRRGRLALVRAQSAGANAQGGRVDRQHRHLSPGGTAVHRQADRAGREFAAQAVIAIENTRLLNELRESLQQQTATADVLKVISRSTFDLQTVLRDARRIGCPPLRCGQGHDHSPEGRSVLSRRSLRLLARIHRLRQECSGRAGARHVLGRALLEGKIVHIADVLADPDYAWPRRRDWADFVPCSVCPCCVKVFRSAFWL